VELMIGNRKHNASKVKNFDYKIVYGFVFEDVLWIRFFIGSYGICIQKKPMIYSKNRRHPIHIPLPFGWRIAFLKAIQ